MKRSRGLAHPGTLAAFSVLAAGAVGVFIQGAHSEELRYGLQWATTTGVVIALYFGKRLLTEFDELKAEVVELKVQMARMCADYLRASDD